jgi:trigger factor
MRETEKVTIELLNKIVADSKIDELPERLVKMESGKMINELKANIENSGMDFENYKESIKKTEDQLIEGFKPKAEERLRMSLVIDLIAEKEKIDATEEELNKELENARNYYATQPNFADIEHNLLDPAYQAHLKKVIKNEKVIKFLREKNLTE